ncbi:aldo/keto reductase [Salinibacterium sp. G-O1]|uniref:aldo/keto reductase n=1 Tax=Salinibacterium sp. G-O1 TaxID=3046208 RepID=UPI0024B954FA|nr:aldo/keto reductase [Salinibacterium sp. G-O1]MDJ0335730.1 aldo/keto reductase [Salinibacterium sp. G-O1]
MPTNAITGLPFTPYAYGAANLGNLFREISDDDAEEILHTAWDAGVRYFDTAPHYGLGLSERRLGAFLATKPRDEFVISTKVGRLLRPNPEGAGSLDTENDFCVPATLKRVWDFSAEGIQTSLTESLERLGLDRVDVLYLHDPEKHDVNAAIDEALPALVSLREAGTVSAVGVGSMSTEALLACATHSDVDLLMIAGRYTLAEQPAAADVLPVCHDKGIGVVTASIFNSGLLSTENPSAGGRYDYGSVPPELWERVLAITDVCRSFDVPLPAAALQYTLRDSAVRSVVVGGSRPTHLRQNAEYMNSPIPEELWTALADRGLIPA